MRPNVLIFMVDQQRFDALGAFGNTVVQTPTIDALAARGVRFDQAWSQHSVCGPSRASFMTGWYPHVAGHRTLTHLLAHDEPNLLRLLKDRGYRSAIAGDRGDVFAPGVTEASTDMCGYIAKPTGGLVDGVEFAFPEGHRMYDAFYFGRQGNEPRLDEPDYREILATYYGMISRTDEQLRRVLEAVERTGGLDDTIVIYLSDHGEYLGDYALIEKWPSGLDPVLVQNPMIIAGPGVTEGGVCPSQVELIDVLPTLLELGGIEPSHTHFGRSLVDLLADPTVPHRDYSFCEGGFNPTDSHLFERPGWLYQHKGDIQHEHPELVAKAMAVRDTDHAYVYRQQGGHELYDRVADPYETTNLIDDPSLAPVRDRLRNELFDWLVRTSDVIDWNADPRRPRIPHGRRNPQDS